MIRFLVGAVGAVALLGGIISMFREDSTYWTGLVLPLSGIAGGGLMAAWAVLQ